MPASSSRLTYVRGFDGIRAIAVIAVFLFHTGHLSGGFLGVDLFFSLSGFLITSLLLTEFEATGGIALGAFWNRRVRRLGPALAMVVVVTYVLVLLRFGGDTAHLFQVEALSALFYLSNWYSMFNDSGALTPYMHMWSLAIEAQFYLVWPVIAVALGDRLGLKTDSGRLSRRLLIVSVCGVAASVVLSTVLYRGPQSLTRVYFGTDTHATGILLGCMLACAFHRWGTVPEGAPRRALQAAAWMALGGIIGSWLILRRDEPALYRSGQYFGFSVLTVVLIAHLSQDDRSVLSRALASTPLRELGVISYGVYIWHWIVIYLTPPDRLGLTEWWRFLFQAVVTIAVATLSYRFVEDPIRHRRRPFSRVTTDRWPARKGTANE